MRKYKIFLIISFILILTIPVFSYPLLKGFDKSTIEENRNKVEFPELNSSFFINFDKYFDDHLPFRGAFIKLYQDFDKKIDISYKNILDALKVPYYIEKNGVVYGKEDWLFLSGDNNMYYYTGINIPSQQELEQIAQKVQKVGNYFKARGKEFLLFIGPNKEEIYSEFLPDAITIINEQKKIDLIVDYIQRNTDVNIVYPKKELLGAKTMGQLYYKYDTHWNRLGGFIGATTILDKLNVVYDKEITYEKTDCLIGDLLTMIAEDARPDTDFVVNFEDDISINVSGNDVVSSNQNNNELLFIGDSFRNAMMEYLGKCYSKSHFNHFDDYCKGREFEDQLESADTIIFESVGRYESDIYASGGLLDRFIEINNI